MQKLIITVLSLTAVFLIPHCRAPIKCGSSDISLANLQMSCGTQDKDKIIAIHPHAPTVAAVDSCMREMAAEIAQGFVDDHGEEYCVGLDEAAFHDHILPFVRDNLEGDAKEQESFVRATWCEIQGLCGKWTKKDAAQASRAKAAASCPATCGAASKAYVAKSRTLVKTVTDKKGKF